MPVKAVCGLLILSALFGPFAGAAEPARINMALVKGDYLHSFGRDIEAFLMTYHFPTLRKQRYYLFPSSAEFSLSEIKFSIHNDVMAIAYRNYLTGFPPTVTRWPFLQMEENEPGCCPISRDYIDIIDEYGDKVFSDAKFASFGPEVAYGHLQPVRDAAVLKSVHDDLWPVFYDIRLKSYSTVQLVMTAAGVTSLLRHDQDGTDWERDLHPVLIGPFRLLIEANGVLSLENNAYTLTREIFSDQSQKALIERLNASESVCVINDLDAVRSYYYQTELLDINGEPVDAMPWPIAREELYPLLDRCRDDDGG